MDISEVVDASGDVSNAILGEDRSKPVPPQSETIEDADLKPPNPKPPDTGPSELEALGPVLTEKEPSVMQVPEQVQSPPDGAVNGASSECIAVPLAESVPGVSRKMSAEAGALTDAVLPDSLAEASTPLDASMDSSAPLKRHANVESCDSGMPKTPSEDEATGRAGSKKRATTALKSANSQAVLTAPADGVQ